MGWTGDDYGEAFKAKVIEFFRREPGCSIYDDPAYDAWAAAQKLHIDRTLLDDDGDYSCLLICGWHDGFTFRMYVENVVSYAKQRAAFGARKKEAA